MNELLYILISARIFSAEWRCNGRGEFSGFTVIIVPVQLEIEAY